MTVLERGRLDDGRRYTVLEEIDVFCALGLRFWDAVGDAPVDGALVVRAWRDGHGRRAVTAARTRSGVHAFHALPGLHRVERPARFGPPGTWPPGEETGASPAAAPLPYVVEVRDLERRFVPSAFRVEVPLPEPGLFLVRPPGSPPGSPGAEFPGFYLFSSPTRPRLPGVAVVRAELRDAATGRPAAHALLRVAIPGQATRWGLADAGGRVAVQFPLPPLAESFGELFASPDVSASPPGPPVAERTWEVAATPYWQPERLAPLPGTDLPDLREVFRQAPAGVLLDLASPPAAPEPEWRGTLAYHGELLATSAGGTELFIVPPGSPP